MERSVAVADWRMHSQTRVREHAHLLLTGVLCITSPLRGDLRDSDNASSGSLLHANGRADAGRAACRAWMSSFGARICGEMHRLRDVFVRTWAERPHPVRVTPLLFRSTRDFTNPLNTDGSMPSQADRLEFLLGRKQKQRPCGASGAADHGRVS